MSQPQSPGGLIGLAAALFFLACGPGRPPPIPIGEPCDPAIESEEDGPVCADGLCVALDSNSGFCSRECADSAECPFGYLCEASGRYGRVCKKLTGCTSDDECPSGHVCNEETGNCFVQVTRQLCSPCQDVSQCPAGGTCFTAIGSEERFCTEPCGAGGTCPLGFVCDNIPAGEGGAVITQCVPEAQTCNFGKTLCSSCSGDVECGGAFDLCVRNVVSGEQFCGTSCRARVVAAPEGSASPFVVEPVDSDCPANFSCVNIGEVESTDIQSENYRPQGSYQCVPNSNTCEAFCNSDNELKELQQCGLGRDCDAVAQRCEAALDGRQCAPCVSTDDCRTGNHPENRCLVNDCPDCSFRGETFCSSPCQDDAACRSSFGPGFVCSTVVEPDGESQGYCVPQRGTCVSGLGRLGDDCSESGAADCVAGVCLKAGSLASLCSLPCTADAECGDNRYRCCEVGDSGYDCSPERRAEAGPLSGSGVCAPLGGLFGDDCSPGRPPCQTGTCLDVGTAQVCTVTCAGGCPAGFSCRQAQSEGGGTVEVCFPEGGGATGSSCEFGPAACQSGLCIRKDSGPVCTAACTEASECPEGWACGPARAVDDESQDYSICLPPAVQ